MRNYSKNYTNRLSVISTVGTSVLTNNPIYKEYINEINTGSKAAKIIYKDGQLSFENESIVMERLYQKLYRDFSFDKNFELKDGYTKSAELSTIYKILLEDANRYFEPNQYELFEALKEYTNDFYDDHRNIENIDLKYYFKSLMDQIIISTQHTIELYKEFLNDQYINSNNKDKQEFGKLILNVIKTNKETPIVKEVDIHYISTDSLLGFVASQILFDATKDKKIIFQKGSIKVTYHLNHHVEMKDYVSLVEYLNVDNSQLFKTYGINNLFMKLDEIIDSYTNKVVKIMYCVTGGHKLIVPFVTLHSYLKAIESYYIFSDEGSQLFKIPRISVSLDNEIVQRHRVGLRQFFNINSKIEITKDNIESLEYMENEGFVLMNREKRFARLSYLGMMFKNKIHELEIKDLEYGSVFERFIYTEFLWSKDSVIQHHFPDSKELTIYNDTEALSTEDNIVFSEFDLILVNENNDYVIGEIKAVAARRKLKDQIQRYVQFMEDKIEKTNQFYLKDSELDQLVHIPKGLKIFLVGDFADNKFKEYSNNRFYESLLEKFNECINNSNNQDIRNMFFGITRVNMSIAKTKTKGDHLEYQDYNFNTHRWGKSYFFTKINRAIELKDKNNNQKNIQKVNNKKESVQSNTHKSNNKKEYNQKSKQQKRTLIKRTRLLKHIERQNKINAQKGQINKVRMNYNISLQSILDKYKNGEKVYISQSNLADKKIVYKEMYLNWFYIFGMIVKKYNIESNNLIKYYYFEKDQIKILEVLGFECKEIDFDKETILEKEAKKLFEEKSSFSNKN